MTPERRNELMDRLEEIGSRVDGLRRELAEWEIDYLDDDDDLDADTADRASIENEIEELLDEKDAVLLQFPEVKYWPQEFGTLIGSTVAHGVKDFNPRKNIGVTQCGRKFRASDKYESDLPWHERALEANGVYLPLCMHCKNR